MDSIKYSAHGHHKEWTWYSATVWLIDAFNRIWTTMEVYESGYTVNVNDFLEFDNYEDYKTGAVDISPSCNKQHNLTIYSTSMLTSVPSFPVRPLKTPEVTANGI